MMLAIVFTLLAVVCTYALHRARVASKQRSHAFYKRGPLVVAGEDDDIEALMNEAEAEIGALLEVGQDKDPSQRAGLLRQARELVKRRPLGFTGVTAITAGTTQTFTAQPQRGIRVNRLLVTTDVPGALIDSIKMADVEQVLTPGIAAEVYGPDALTDSVPDNFDAVAANATVTVTVRNPTAGTINVTVGAKCAVLSTGA